jgi:diguanylate cyclase (GGDEF)-like protein
MNSVKRPESPPVGSTDAGLPPSAQATRASHLTPTNPPATGWTAALKQYLTRPDRVKAQVICAFAVIMLLALLVSVFTFVRGHAVNMTTAGFVGQDLPAFTSLFDLKLAVMSEEPIVYDYYATQDSTRFRVSHATNAQRIARGLALLKDSGLDAASVSEIEGHYLQLGRLAKDLDQTLDRPFVDWVRASALLSSISDHAEGINRGVDHLMQVASGNVEERGKHTRQEVSGIVTMVAAFSVATLILLITTGYSLRAYIAESTRRRQLALFPERNPHPILSVRADGTPVYANRGALNMLAECGLPPTHMHRLLPGDLSKRLAALKQSGGFMDALEYQACGRALSGEIHPLPDYDLFHVYLSDVSERRQFEETLIHRAYHDAVTNLPNRYSFHETLSEALAHGRRGAVLLLSVDRFRLFVDSFGHAAGDEVLKAVAARLDQALRASWSASGVSRLFRMDSAQFAIVARGVESAAELDEHARLLREVIAGPVKVKDRELLLSFSIGGSLFPIDGMDAEVVVRSADRAMQSVRKQGGNGYCHYGPQLDAQHLELLEMETALRLAHERGEMALHFQPQVNIRTGALIGFEALLRWQHPEHGMMPTQRFIAVAEETGLIIPIGEWVLRTACIQAREWLGTGLRNFTMGVNVSARQFTTGDLPATVSRIVQETRLDPSYLELEITESVAMHDVERTIATLSALRDIGVKLAIDDFGTGYSSLSYLKRFPIHRLKIDQSFVRNVASDPNDAAITRAIIALARSLKLGLIAEGVETEAQRALLARCGCKEIQGYLVARPAPASELQLFLSGNAQRQRLKTKIILPEGHLLQ